MKVFLVAGARPNFMKIAPLHRAARHWREIDCRIVHTGQHYDAAMSSAFFADLEIPEPDFLLNVGSGSHAVQTGKIMVAFEEVCEREKPDLVLVVGDVNSTLACSIAAKKLKISVAHVEAGLRSFDMDMPEEVNRRVTDSISNYFFVTEEEALRNLLREGMPGNKIWLVGNVMIDNLFFQLQKLDGKASFPTAPLKRGKSPYLFLTLHRPSNVDDPEVFAEIARGLNEIARERTIFFPVHPRTRNRIQTFGIRLSGNIVLLPPLGFDESLFLWKDAEAVLTDSGGLQEETTALGVPCVTIRENTERPITVNLGSNILAGTRAASILDAYRASLAKRKSARVPPRWDGRSAERIWSALLDPASSESNRQRKASP